ncbi:MAG TPA: hypothetical protein QF373_10335, partial [Verrucomicrobiota bacterium]|nr:hypothetical protein [Verrucomicrobiota bacterium]
VHEVLSDYGIHGMRIMRFVPKRDLIEVRTWNPVTGQLCLKTSFVSQRNQHQFELAYPMPAREKEPAK